MWQTRKSLNKEIKRLKKQLDEIGADKNQELISEVTGEIGLCGIFGGPIKDATDLEKQTREGVTLGGAPIYDVTLFSDNTREKVIISSETGGPFRTGLRKAGVKDKIIVRIYKVKEENDE